MSSFHSNVFEDMTNESGGYTLFHGACLIGHCIVGKTFCQNISQFIQTYITSDTNKKIPKKNIYYTYSIF